MHPERIAALILAAGRSSRMGGFKPLLDLGGRTVLETLVETYRAAGLGDLLVVLGHRAEEVRPLLDARGVPWVVNDRPERRMFSSSSTSKILTGISMSGSNMEDLAYRTAFLLLLLLLHYGTETVDDSRV